MLKRRVLIYLVVLACLGLGYFIYSSFTYQVPVPKDKNIYINAVHHSRTLELSLYEAAINTGHFKLRDLDSLTLHVPREFINHLPYQPNGEVEHLELAFFLPEVGPRKALEKQFSYMDRQRFDRLAPTLELRTVLHPAAKYKKYWGGECFGPDFARFQIDCRLFQDSIFNEAICSLKEGHYDSSLDLVVYKGHTSLMIDEDISVDFNEMYLSQETDPSHPDQWIICTKHFCRQHWFRDGLHIETVFNKCLLPLHKMIRTKLNQKIDKFICYVIDR